MYPALEELLKLRNPRISKWKIKQFCNLGQWKTVLAWEKDRWQPDKENKKKLDEMLRQELFCRANVKDPTDA